MTLGNEISVWAERYLGRCGRGGGGCGCGRRGAWGGRGESQPMGMEWDLPGALNAWRRAINK